MKKIQVWPSQQGHYGVLYPDDLATPKEFNHDSLVYDYSLKKLNTPDWRAVRLPDGTMGWIKCKSQ
jgi:hypothetical protein